MAHGGREMETFLENSLASLTKWRVDLTSDSASPLPGVSRDVPTAKKNENTSSQKDCVRALTAALGSGPGSPTRGVDTHALSTRHES